MTADSRSIATEMPSTPTAYWMLSDAYQTRLSVKSICAVSPAPRSPRYCTTSTPASATSSEEPATITV